MLFTREWWKATAIRIARTAAQTLIAGIGADQLGWINHWWSIVMLVLTMSILSFATAVAFPPPESK